MHKVLSKGVSSGNPRKHDLRKLQEANPEAEVKVASPLREHYQDRDRVNSDAMCTARNRRFKAAGLVLYNRMVELAGGKKRGKDGT
jgi:hypothetical protein